MAFERMRGKIADFVMGGMSLPMISLSGGEHYRLDAAGALYSVAFMSCEQVKMLTIGSLPVHVYKKTPLGRVEVDHPLTKILMYRWNPLMTAADGLSWLILRRDMFGNAFVRVIYDARHNPVAFYPINSRVDLKLDTNYHEASYEVVGQGDSITPPGFYREDDIIHFKTPFADESMMYGRSIAELAAREVGLTIDLERFYKAMLDNGSHFPGQFTTDQTLSPKDIESLNESIKETRGVSRAGEARMFGKGVKWEANPVNVGDAALLEQQTWHLQQVCRATNVPPQKVYDLSRSTYSNVEQGQLDFVQSTVVPEVRGIELVMQTILEHMGLNDHFVKFDLNGLLRGAYKDRMEGYRVGIYAGFFNRNEVRAWEDLPRIEGLDKPLVPQAYGTLEQDGSITPVNQKKTPAQAAIEPILADAENRIADRVASRGPDESTRQFAIKVLTPIALAMARADIEFDVSAEAERMIDNAQLV